VIVWCPCNRCLDCSTCGLGVCRDLGGGGGVHVALEHSIHCCPRCGWHCAYLCAFHVETVKCIFVWCDVSACVAGCCFCLIGCTHNAAAAFRRLGSCGLR
jgi:hypothetical protein